MAEERAQSDEPREVEEHRDDLELPDETAEEVKGGSAANFKYQGQKLARDKT